MTSSWMAITSYRQCLFALQVAMFSMNTWKAMSWNSARTVCPGNDTRRMGRARWVEIGRRSHPAAVYEARHFETRRVGRAWHLCLALSPIVHSTHFHSHSRINTCLTLREREKTAASSLPCDYLLVIFVIKRCYSYLCFAPLFSRRYLPGTVTTSLLC